MSKFSLEIDVFVSKCLLRITLIFSILFCFIVHCFYANGNQSSIIMHISSMQMSNRAYVIYLRRGVSYFFSNSHSQRFFVLCACLSKTFFRYSLKHQSDWKSDDHHEVGEDFKAEKTVFGAWLSSFEWNLVA